MPKKAATPKKVSVKTEAVIAIRPRVGSALAEVRKAVVDAGGNMGDVFHDWAERHKSEVLNETVQAPGFD